MALAKSRRGPAVNYWPGYVDMLSTLLLVVTFLMSLFMLSSYFITTQTSGKDTMLSRLNRQLSQLTELLALERSKKELLEDSLSALQATLIDKDKENARLTGLLGDQNGKTEGAEAKTSALSGQLDQQKQITNEALAKVEILNQQLAALRLQLAALQEALDASEAKDRESQVKIADLGQRLNVALAKKVQELARYRSDFFGKLREVLGSRADFQVVGDRFVFPADVLFELRLRRSQARSHAPDRQARRRTETARDADPARYRLGAQDRRPHRHQADHQRELPVELGAVRGARHLRGALSDRPRHSGEPPGRGGLRRIPATRSRRL